MLNYQRVISHPFLGEIPWGIAHEAAKKKEAAEAHIDGWDPAIQVTMLM